MARPDASRTEPVTLPVAVCALALTTDITNINATTIPDQRARTEDTMAVVHVQDDRLIRNGRDSRDVTRTTAISYRI